MSEDEEYKELLIGYEFFLDLMRRFGNTLEEAKSTLHRMFSEDLAGRIIRYWEQLVADQANADRGVALIKGLGAADAWYPGPGANDVYWTSLRNHLLSHPSKPWTADDVSGLDLASNTVLASCRSPWDSTSAGRGLVVGYVQSGKTTNFTAVIAKAADAGFRLFIVLSGTTKSLRRQTQVRLEEQLMALNPHSWYFHTTLDADIGKNTNWVPFLGQKAMRTCLVVKKNKKRLQNLNKSLDAAEKLGILADCPVLVIDDEGDNASLSPNCDPTKAMAINKQIVKAINRPRVTYVAYTATPFANCFVDPEYQENLFPRDFICGLPEPDGYFGARRLHGTGDDSDVQAVIDVPPAEADGYLVPPPPEPDTHSLREAVLWFLLATTARRIRKGGAQPHSTMLVNVSERIEAHHRYWFIVRDIVAGIAASRAANDSTLTNELATLWERETQLVDAGQFGLQKVGFAAIDAELDATISLLGPINGADHNSNPDCGIVIDNSTSALRLAYDDDAPRPVIVVGGNTLSRGLTLEGLTSTFFLRSTRLYDTLLQMGRWFGYRPGYEDLFRIWMPSETREKFEFLARIEIELRDWIETFARTGMTPLEFGPRFRMHPQMQITRASLMKRARVERLDLAGTQPETSIFENTITAVGRHQFAAARLAGAALSSSGGEKIPEGHLFRNVDADDIVEFFGDDGFGVVGHSYLKNDILLDYVAKKRLRGELGKWNVLFRRKTGGAPVGFLRGIDASLVVRTRKSANGDFLDVGSLADSGDKWKDIPSDWPGTREQYRSQHPLLVIYVIDKDSKATKNARVKNREDLGAVDHLVGVALFMPQTSHSDNLGDFAVPPGPWDDITGEPPADEPDPDADDEAEADGTPPTA